MVEKGQSIDQFERRCSPRLKKSTANSQAGFLVDNVPDDLRVRQKQLGGAPALKTKHPPLKGGASLRMVPS